jgi:hypothetical protein
MRSALPESLRTRNAWRAAMTSCLINAVGTPLDLWVGRHAELPRWPVLACAAFGAVGAAVLLFRRTASIAFSSSVFVLQAMAVSSVLWVISPAWAATGVPWTPFQANKLGMLIVAAMGPELLPGLIGIGCFALAALLRLGLLEGAPTAADEPGVFFIFMVVAVVLLAMRVRGAASERALARARADVATSTELNHRLLALRDLANTPLQTIEVGVAMLSSRHPEARSVTAALERAVLRMRDLQPLLGDDPRGQT